jgi:site-specific recombinase XerD
MAKKPQRVEGVYERIAGSDVWSARIRVNKKLVRKSFGRGPKGRAEAIAWVEKARTIKRTGEGVLPTTAKRPIRTTEELKLLGDPDAITVKKLCDEFERYVKAHPEEYRDQTNPPKRIAEIREKFGGRVAASMKSSEIEDWLDEIQKDRKLANATINKIRGTFSMIYKHGKRKDLVNTNPAVDVPLREVGNGVERFLSEEEERRLRRVLQRNIEAHDSVEHPQLRKQAIHRLLEFEVSLKSGMRRSEQYNLRWGDIDFERRIMRLRKTKNGKPRNAYMIDDVVAALKQLQELDLERRDRSASQPNKSPQDVVFAKADNKKWWQVALNAAKVKNYRWHDNRHTFCSRLVQAGVHLKVVQEAAGHASMASTMRYAHFAPSQVVNAMAVLNAKVETSHHGA